MKEKENLLLVSEKGILNSNSEPYPNVPFQGASVNAGEVCGDQVAVIVGKHEVWTYDSGGWYQAAATEIKLNCICWTSDRRLLVGTESARLAWLSDGDLKFIDSFFLGSFSFFCFLNQFIFRFCNNAFFSHVFY